MRIKKTSQTTPVQAEIVNAYSTSTEDGYSASYINGLFVYSYNERVIGTTEDGKPLYERVYKTTMPDSTSVSIPTGLTSECFIENYYGTYSSGLTAFTLPSIRNAFPDYQTEFYISNGTITVSMVNVARPGYKLRVVVQYTKTTD